MDMDRMYNYDVAMFDVWYDECIWMYDGFYGMMFYVWAVLPVD